MYIDWFILGGIWGRSTIDKLIISDITQGIVGK